MKLPLCALLASSTTRLRSNFLQPTSSSMPISSFMASSTLVYCVSKSDTVLAAHVDSSGNAVDTLMDDDFEWPDNMYEEMRDMAVLSFLVYAFAYICDVARNTEGGLRGLGLMGDQNRIQKETLVTEEPEESIDLPRSFTPGEILNVVTNNREVLGSKYNTTFGSGTRYELLLDNLEALKERAAQSGLERPLTLEEFDDRHQQHEMVYGITKDDTNRRITLVFRGTESELSFRTNWLTNLYLAKTKVPMPEFIKSLNDDTERLNENMWMHSGFYNYVFALTKDETDDESWRKYDEILEDVRTLLNKHPGYKLYVTGHSLGGALAAMVSFFLTCEPDIPKPVTCISLASPRIGNYDYLQAVRTLERNNKLRFVRIVNDKDTVAAVPLTGYHHAGFQVKVFKTNRAPTLIYPRIGETLSGKVFRIWANSLLLSFNFGYDHGDYRERIDRHKAVIEKWNLDKLYSDVKLTGWMRKM